MAWRIRYDIPKTNYEEEYWHGDLNLDELLCEIHKALSEEDVCPSDIIIPRNPSPLTW